MSEPINPYQAPVAAESPLMTTRRIAPDKKMRRLVLGLGVLRAAMFVSAAYIIGVYGGEFLAFALHSWGASERVLTLASALRDVAYALGLAGALLCLAAPVESKALAWIQASAITGILAWVVRGLEYVPGIVEGTLYLRQALEYGSTAATVVFLLKLCGWLERSDFAHRAANLLKLLGVAAGARAVVIAVAFVALRFQFDVPRLDIFLGVLVGDVLFVLFAIKTFQLLGAIRSEIQAGWETRDTVAERNDVA
jgi:hypothetical protein